MYDKKICGGGGEEMMEIERYLVVDGMRNGCWTVVMLVLLVDEIGSKRRKFGCMGLAEVVQKVGVPRRCFL